MLARIKKAAARVAGGTMASHSPGRIVPPYTRFVLCLAQEAERPLLAALVATGTQLGGDEHGLWTRFAEGEGQQRCDKAKEPRGKESRQIGVERSARQAGAECRGRSAELMAAENPAEHRPRLVASKALRRRLDHGWYGRDPVQPVEHREQRQAVERE